MTPADRDTPPPDSDEPDGAYAQEPDAGGAEDVPRSGFTEEFEKALESDFGDQFGAELDAPDDDEDDAKGEEPAGEEQPSAADDEPQAREQEPPVEDEPPAEDEPSLEEDPAAEGEPAPEDEPDDADEPAERVAAVEPESPHDRGNQETIEADVLALGDAEEAAEQAAAEGVGDEDADDDDVAAGADSDEAEEPADEEAPVAAAVVADSEPPPGPATPGGVPSAIGEDEGDGPPKSRLWLRFLTASFVIVVSMATATAVTGLLYLTDIAKGLGGLPGIRSQLPEIDGGEPQNILILGSDQRPGDPSARSDTTMLLRLDPDQDAIALFSLPRDLKVNIPGYGVDRLNAAYAFGGPKLTLKTVKQITGLTVHHVVNVDFTGFYQAVNAIDCVYVDIDRSYYVPPEASYSEINIEAGYQLLCGERALQYVRFRHADTDITRSARQQDFLREARQKISPTRLFRDREDLIDIFKRYTTSDIEEAGAMLEVLKLFLSVTDAPVKEVHFEGNIGPSYITFSQEQMQAAVEDFQGLQDTEGPRGGGALGAESDGGGGGGGGGGDKPESEPSLIDSAEFGRGVAEQFVGKARFPIYYPTKLTPGSQFSDDSRVYEIEDEDGKVHSIYKIVIQSPLLGEYYGVSGTTWEDPPILGNPSETREIGDREFDLFFDGDRLRMVAWHTDKGSYWLNNSLLQSIDEEQMLEIAETTEDVEPK